MDGQHDNRPAGDTAAPLPPSSPPRPPLDNEKVKRLTAFFKFARAHWDYDPVTGKCANGPSTLDELDNTVIDGVNIGEVYRELKGSAVKRMQETPIEDAPSVEELSEQWGI